VSTVLEASAAPPAGRRRTRRLHAREFGTLAGLLVLCLALWIATPHFLTVSNLLNVVQQSAIIGIVAVGMTFVILSGGIDLSVGSLVALSGIALGTAVQAGAPVPAAAAVGLGVGLASGLVNGALVTLGRIPPFIATLGMMSVARGLALMLSDGRPISGYPESFRFLATGHLLGVPVPVILMLAIYALAHLVLTRTLLGRYTYAIGGNEDAAALSGVPVRAYKAAVYGISGLLSAVTSLVLVARLNSAQPIAGIMYELDAIAAVVIGGTSLLGGSGSVAGTLVGALIMATLRNGLNLLGVSSYVQQVAIGVVIVAAVLVDVGLRRRAARGTVV
jgi:ribose/xylose/arabinose/galactoside ABC-type transport system permease subunit